MASIRSQTSYLSSLPPQAAGKSKLRKEAKDYGGNVLFKDNKPPAFNSGYGIAAVNGLSPTARPAPGTSSEGGSLKPRIQASVQRAKERREARHQAKHGNDISQRGNLVIDEDGVAHDSEYVQFRTATPVHLHQQRQSSAFPDDDGSASSSSSSEDGSDGPSSPYTYQSTRTTATSHHHYSTPMGTTASAVPSYLQPKPQGRSSLDYPSSSSSLSVPRAPSPRRSSAEYERPSSSSTGKTPRSRHASGPQFTTSSYQPPAPAFNPRAMDFTGTSLRLPPKPVVPAAPSSHHSDGNSLAESFGQMSVEGAGGGSGYNKFAHDTSMRPPKVDGSLVAAGTHGLKRSFDGFKLEVKFGSRALSKKLERKLKM